MMRYPLWWLGGLFTDGLCWKLYPYCLCFLAIITMLPSGFAIKCSQCDSLKYPDCESVPPPPTTCAFCEIADNETGDCLNYTDFDFCIIMRKYVNDTLISTTRACNPISTGEYCRPANDKAGHPVSLCFDSCKTDGCNRGSRQGSIWATIPIAFCLFLASIIDGGYTCM